MELNDAALLTKSDGSDLFNLPIDGYYLSTYGLPMPLEEHITRGPTRNLSKVQSTACSTGHRGKIARMHMKSTENFRLECIGLFVNKDISDEHRRLQMLKSCTPDINAQRPRKDSWKVSTTIEDIDAIFHGLSAH